MESKIDLRIDTAENRMYAVQLQPECVEWNYSTPIGAQNVAEVRDDVPVLRAQLAARDEALNAVLLLAREWANPHNHDISAIPWRQAGSELIAALGRRGVR